MSGKANGTEIVERIDSILNPKKKNRNDLCKELEMKSNTISSWLTRGTVPGADVAIRIADYLGVSVRWLVFGEEDSDVKENLTADEMELLDLWRGIDDSHKPTALLMLKGLPLKKSAVDSSVHTA